MTEFDGRAPRFAVMSSAKSPSFVTSCADEKHVDTNAPALPRGSTHDRV